MQDFFTLFGLPPGFALDLEQLNQAYREVQARVHPDRFVQASDAERRVAAQWSMTANEGYQVLKDPVQRARYLCERAGCPLNAESNTGIPGAFLMQQMAWRETLEDLRHDGRLDDCNALEDEVLRTRRDVLATLASAFEQHDYEGARSTLYRLMFIERFVEEIDHAREALETH